MRPGAEEVLRRVVQEYDVDEILWDVDGTLVPGRRGLVWDTRLDTVLEDKYRLCGVVLQLWHVDHTVASRNMIFGPESSEVTGWLHELGFTGHLLGLHRKLATPKHSVGHKRALLIDDQLRECLMAVEHPTVAAAIHLKGNRGAFHELDTANYEVITPKDA